jgi:HSP20 family molecular chaperone IbpA
MNSFSNDDIFSRGLFPGFREMFDTDLSVKVKETENGREYRFALPGVARENINIDVEGEYLIVQAEEKNDGESRFARYRSVLSPDANVDTIKAKYVDGLLTVAVEDHKEEKKPVSVQWIDGKESIEGTVQSQHEVEESKASSDDKSSVT